MLTDKQPFGLTLLSVSISFSSSAILLSRISSVSLSSEFSVSASCSTNCATDNILTRSFQTYVEQSAKNTAANLVPEEYMLAH